MKKWVVTILLIVLCLAIVAGLAWLAFDRWLDSANGRRAVELALGERLGVRVALQGELDFTLPPRSGVRGTHLLLLDPQSGQTLVRSERFDVAMLLRPLLREEIHVSRLTISGIDVGGGVNGVPDFHVPKVSVTGLAPGETARFSLDLGPYGEAAGTFTWYPARRRVDLQFAWGGFLFPRVDLRTVVEYTEESVGFDPIELDVDGQRASGHGCLLLAGMPELNLDLQAPLLDLEVLGADLGRNAGVNDSIPLDINLRLTVDEARRGEVRAYGTVLEWGRAPVCPNR